MRSFLAGNIDPSDTPMFSRRPNHSRREKIQHALQKSVIEALEPRQLLSFSSTLISDVYSLAGNTWNYKITSTSSTVTPTIAYTSYGTQTKDGISGDEIEAAETETLGTETDSYVTDDFYGQTSDGFADFGTVTQNTVNGLTASTVSTLSPNKILVPTTLTEGTPYVQTYTRTTITTQTGVTASTSTSTFQQTVSLASNSLNTVTLSDGSSYSAYELDVTTVNGYGGPSPTTTYSSIFLSSSVGLVEEIYGPTSAPTGTLQLVNSTITARKSDTGGSGSTGGTGGTTGTGTASVVTPTVLSSTLAGTIVAGSKLNDSVRLSLANTAATVTKGSTVKVYATTDSTLDTTTATLVKTLALPALRASRSVPLSIRITSLPATLSTGTYNIFVETADTSGDTTSVQSGTVTVQAPAVTLSETITTKLPSPLISGVKLNGLATVNITNNGNVASHGDGSLTLSDSATSGVGGTTIIKLPKVLMNIPVGRTEHVPVPIKLIPKLDADGQYYFVAQVTSPFDGSVTSGSTAAPVTIEAPVIILTGTLGPVTTLNAGDTLTIVNSGNIPDITTLTGTIGFALDSLGAMPVGKTATASHGYRIPAGGKIEIHSKQWAQIKSGLIAGVPYFLTISETDTDGNNVFAVSPNSFTL